MSLRRPAAQPLPLAAAALAALCAGFGIAAGCGGGGSAGSAAGREGGADAPSDVAAPSDAAAPVIRDLAITPSPTSVLGATVTFTTDVPATDVALVTNAGAAANTFSTPASAVASTAHSIAVIGMRAQSTFDIAVTARTAAGGTATGHVAFTTPALPAGLPPFTVVASDRTRTSPGFTLLSTWKWEGGLPDPGAGFLVALDADGQVVWYYQTQTALYASPSDPEKLPSGHIAYVRGELGWAEIDMMGNVVRQGLARSLGLDSLHHDIVPEASGNLLSLSTQMKGVAGFTGPDGGKATYPLVGDVIVELSPDGGVLQRWSSFDFLGGFVHSQGTQSQFDTGFWDYFYPDAGATKDWTHGDSIAVDPTDDGLVMSSRTQSWIVKIDRSGKLLWRLGPGGDFALPGNDFQWNQHAASVLPGGHVMCFDDGDSRPVVAGGPPGPDGGPAPYSRAVEFALDTTAMTASVAWQYLETPTFYSWFLGSSDLLPNGNVLICDGGEIAQRDGAGPYDPTNLKTARILEVTHDATPVKVLDVRVDVPLGGLPGDPQFAGYSVFRARRIPSLY